MLATILFLIGFVVLATFAYAGWSAAPWVPIHRKDVDRAIAIAHITPGERLYDLGCGDGRIVFAAGRAGARSIGYEISVLPYAIAKVHQWVTRGREGRVLYRDLWSASIADADIVYLFLMPEMYGKLKIKLKRELKDGARVIVHAWPVDEWTPTATDDQQGRLKVFSYIMPQNNGE